MEMQWWYIHAAVIYSGLIQILFWFLALVISPVTVFGLIHYMIGITVILTIMSIPAYYFDRDIVERQTAATWEPSPTLYVIATFIITPFFACFIYLMIRDRHVDRKPIIRWLTI
jgi:hypothetical protein